MLGGKAASLVTPMPEDQQTLKDTSISVENGVTTMKFTKIMKEAGEIEISTGVNTFLWAYGSSNTLGYHAGRDPFDINLLSIPSSAISIGDEVCIVGYLMDNCKCLFPSPSSKLYQELTFIPSLPILSHTSHFLFAHSTHQTACTIMVECFSTIRT